MQNTSVFIRPIDFIAGYFAGITTVISGLPFDIIKLRLQTQGTVYKSSLSCASVILSKEGILAFYKGASSPLLGLCFSVAIQFSCNEFAKNYFRNKNLKLNGNTNLSAMDFIKIGVFPGLCNSIVVSPIELIIIKMQCLKSKYKGTFDCLTCTYLKRGIKGLYQGYSATIFRELPANSIYFGFYEISMDYYAKYYFNGRENISLFYVLATGAIAGFLSWLFTYPHDVIKSLMQADDPYDRKFKSIFTTAHHIYSEHQGFKGFFNGIVPCLIRAPIVNALTFLTFEITLKILNNDS